MDFVARLAACAPGGGIPRLCLPAPCCFAGRTRSRSLCVGCRGGTGQARSGGVHVRLRLLELGARGGGSLLPRTSFGGLDRRPTVRAHRSRPGTKHPPGKHLWRPRGGAVYLRRRRFKRPSRTAKSAFGAQCRALDGRLDGRPSAPRSGAPERSPARAFVRLQRCPKRPRYPR